MQLPLMQLEKEFLHLRSPSGRVLFFNIYFTFLKCAPQPPPLPIALLPSNAQSHSAFGAGRRAVTVPIKICCYF